MADARRGVRGERVALPAQAGRTSQEDDHVRLPCQSQEIPMRAAALLTALIALPLAAWAAPATPP
ncbi:MAG: hypothetical protein ACYCZI_12680, partial [Metallibacterium scheffleri]